MKIPFLFPPSFITALLCLSISSYAQSPPHTDLSEAKLAIASSNNNYFQAFAKNDPAIFINSYAQDCKIMLPNAPALDGHKGALEFFNIAYTKIGLRGGKFITIDVYDAGDGYAVEEGFWESVDKNNKVFDHGKFLVLWKKTSSGWKMYRDSFNSDLPGMAPQESTK